MGATKEPENPPVEAQDIFDIIGSFGPWQKTVFAILFCVNIVGVWQNFGMTFLAPNMDFWCVEPTTNFSWPRNSSDFPGSDTKYQCYVPIFNVTSSELTSDFQFNRTEITHGLQLNRTTKCTKWEYDTSFFSDTLVSEWDLVCDREWLISFAKSIYMVGYFLSVMVFGQLSDCIGRFPTIVITYIIMTVSLMLSLFSQSYLMFVILRFLQAFGRTGLTTVFYVLLMEIIGSEHRTSIGLAIQVGWSIGFCALAFVGYFFRNYFWFQLAIAVPYLPLTLAYKFVPESPRWLLMQKKYKVLEKLLTKAAVRNKRGLKCDVKDLKIFQDRDQVVKVEKRKTIFDVFKTPKMRYRLINMIYVWVANAFLYYALSFNTNDLAGNPYLNFFISGILEIPSFVVAYLGIRKFGRRPTLVTLMLCGGTACGVIFFVPDDLPWLSTTLAMIGKFFLRGAFGLIYLYTSELFPTVVRNVTVGCCSMFGRIGAIVAPFVREMGKATHPSVPNVVYFILAVSSGLLALLLPETKGCKIPDTLEEGEHFGESTCSKDPVPDSKKEGNV